MVVQDPLMSFFSFVVAPPAFFVLRKMIRRIYSIARSQFHGNTQIIETLQETLQGIRIVKAFTLEDIMRERFDRNVAAVEHEANKMARVSNRASPLMETLGGCAIAIALIYAGYRVVVTGATPGNSSPSSRRSFWPTSRPSAWRGSISSSTARWSACASCSR